MKKRKSLFSIVLAVLVLVLTVATLVACNKPQAVKYTITFDDGSGTVKTAQVEEGKGLTAEQIPAAATVEGKNFEGWYIGETRIEAGYVPTADVTATAKYSTVKVTVTFKNGSDVFKTVELDYGTAIASDKLPTDVSKENHKFLGWYDGETKFTGDMTFNADKTFTAKFERTAYVITLTFASAENDDIVRVIPVDGATFPADLIPETVPTVANKVFLGFYNGAVKAEVGMEITDDVTFTACYVGKDDYTGVWVDEDNGVAVFFDDEYFYVGTDYSYISNLTFDGETGAMNYPKPSYGTGWSLSIAGNQMRITKLASDGTVEYTATKQTEQVDYAGVYIKDDSNKIIIGDGGYALIMYGYYPKYSYARIYKTGEDYALNFKTEEWSKTTYVSAGANYFNVLGTEDKGIWVKNSAFEFTISGGGSTIYKHNVDGEFVYVLKNAAEDYAVVTLDKELTKTDGDIITVTLAGNSAMVIKVVEDNSGWYSSYEYLIADETRGTYTATFDNEGTPIKQTLVFDGFGKVTVSSEDDSETYSYKINAADIIVVENSFGVILKGNTCDVLDADGYEGTYKNFNVTGHYDYVIELDGFGQIKALRGSSTVKIGTYTVNKDNNTITVTGIQSDDYIDGTYDFMFENETAHIDGTYWCKNDDNDRFNDIRGRWLNNGSTLAIDAFMGEVEIAIDDEKATSVLIIKYDRSVIKFTLGDVEYTLTIGDVANSVKLTWNGGEKVYTPAPTVDEAFFGTWSNDDETIKVVIEEDQSIKADFSATSDELADATLIASNAQNKSITVTVADLTYVITLDNDSLVVTQAENPVATLLKEIIKSDYIGEWKASDESKTYNLVFTGKTVTLNGQAGLNVSQNYNNVSFVVDGVEYKFYASLGDLDFYENSSLVTIKMVKDSSGDGEDTGEIITDANFYGTWKATNQYSSSESIILVIDANGVTFNGNETTELTYENGEINFMYDGKKYNICENRLGTAYEITEMTNYSFYGTLEQQ